MTKRIAALFAASLFALLVAAPALAADLTNKVPISSDDASLQGTDTDCAGLNLQPGQVDWHFVLNQSSTDNQTVTASFQNAGMLTQSPDKVVDHYVLHYDFVTGTDTLLSASSSGDGMLQLSHICNGGPPPEVAEAPLSALLLLSAGMTGVLFVGWRRRTTSSAE